VGVDGMVRPLLVGVGSVPRQVETTPGRSRRSNT
jgi:hypothetical protein